MQNMHPSNMSVDDGVDAIPGIVRSEEHVATIKTQVADALERYKTAWLRYWSHEFRVFELPAGKWSFSIHC